MARIFIGKPVFDEPREIDHKRSIVYPVDPIDARLGEFSILLFETLAEPDLPQALRLSPGGVSCLAMSGLKIEPLPLFGSKIPICQDLLEQAIRMDVFEPVLPS